jgi:hypothetical protein
MIHVNRGTTNLGKYSESEVRDGLHTGRFAITDIGWREGMPAWTPLHNFPEIASPTAPVPLSHPAPAAIQHGSIVTLNIPSLMRRYREGYRVASTIMALGIILKVIGVVLAALAVLGGFYAGRIYVSVQIFY